MIGDVSLLLPLLDVQPSELLEVVCEDGLEVSVNVRYTEALHCGTCEGFSSCRWCESYYTARPRGNSQLVSHHSVTGSS